MPFVRAYGQGGQTPERKHWVARKHSSAPARSGTWTSRVLAQRNKPPFLRPARGRRSVDARRAPDEPRVTGLARVRKPFVGGRRGSTAFSGAWFCTERFD